MIRAKNPILRWLPAIVWMIVIFWFSSQPDLPRPNNDLLDFILRKIAHFITYAVLALCYLYALGDQRHWRVALLLAVLYAISDEYHQSWTPKRHPAWTDVVIDSAGAATALALQALIQRRIIAPTQNKRIVG